MRQCKIMSLITWYLVYLFQVEICGRRLELHTENVETVNHQTTSKFQSYIQPTTDSFNLHPILLLPLRRKSTPAVLKRPFNPQYDFKSIDRADDFAPLSEKRRAKETSNTADLLSEHRHKIHVSSVRVDDKTTSSTILLPSVLRDSSTLIQLSGQTNPESSEFKSLNVSKHFIVKRSVRDGSSDRIPNPRTAGLKVSNVEKPSELTCPALGLRMRTIVTCTNGTKIGSKCLFHCTPGFGLTGNRRSRRCRTNEIRKKYIPYWSGKERDFQCVPICQTPPNPDHGTHRCHWQKREKGRVLQCKTECKRGYRVAGSQHNTCYENGNWLRHMATCKGDHTRGTPRVRFKFQEHQSLTCGEAHTLTFFRKEETVYLAAGDKLSNVVRIYRWYEGKFIDMPHQTFYYLEPELIQALTAPDGAIWLMVSGPAPDATLYRLQENGRFELSHKVNDPPTSRQGPDPISFAELRGEFYRCYGRNRRETPVVVVHKFQNRQASGNRNVFRRIMRKKLPGEKIRKCSLYSEGNSIYSVLTVNKFDGRGRILIGHLAKKRMKTIDVISGHKLWKVSDSVEFTMEREKYLAVSQATQNGRCTIYKRHWFNQRPVENG